MIEFRTYVVSISADGEDRFPYGFKPTGAPITKTQTDGSFDFPLDFEFVTSGNIGAYKGIPNYLVVDSDGRTQYYFLTPIAPASPRYENEVSVAHPYKFAAHKDVFTSFNVEDIGFQMPSRIYQGHYLGGYSYYARNNAYSPDWTSNTTRYMPHHLDTIKNIYPLAESTSFRVFVFFTQKSDGTNAGKRRVICTTSPIPNWIGASSVSLFIFMLNSTEYFSVTSPISAEPVKIYIESIDDIYVVPSNIAVDADFGNAGQFINGTGYIPHPDGRFDYGFVSGVNERSNSFVTATVVWETTSNVFNSKFPYGNKFAYEIGCGSSWVRLLPRVSWASPDQNMRPGIAFVLSVGEGGVFQLTMSVMRPNEIQSIELSQYCSVPFQWRDLDSKSDQKTAAGIQLASSVLQTAASVALAYPTGGLSLVGAIGGASSLIGGYYNYKQISDAPPPSTAGSGTAPGSFISATVDGTTISRVGGFPFVRVYTLSYADDIGGEMYGAYAENTGGEPFTLSIKEQWRQFETVNLGSKVYPRYIYIRADAVPYIDRKNYITAYMTQSDIDEFISLIKRGVRLWLGDTAGFAPNIRQNFWTYPAG